MNEFYAIAYVAVAALSGGGGGLALFLYGLRRGHYKNNRIITKFSIEIFGAVVTAAFLSFIFLPDDNFRLVAAVAFAIGVGWSNIVHALRNKITAMVEAALGERVPAARSTPDKADG